MIKMNNLKGTENSHGVLPTVVDADYSEEKLASQTLGNYFYQLLSLSIFLKFGIQSKMIKMMQVLF